MLKKDIDIQATLDAFSAFTTTIAALRDPTTGCPWDLVQTHTSLRVHMLEEAYEAVAAMSAPVDIKNLCEELGDVLLQVFLHAQLAKEAGTFTMLDILEGIQAKMIRCHPHVFGASQVKDAEGLSAQWESIKAQEQGTSHTVHEATWIPYPKIEKIHPASQQGAAIGKAIQKWGLQFDFERDPLSDLVEEVAELQEVAPFGTEKLQEIEQEIGDVYFCLAQVCRKFGLDPELTALAGNQKILSRLKQMETMANAQERKLEMLTRTDMEALWQGAKGKSPSN